MRSAMVVVASVGVALAVAGCSSSAEEPPGLTASPTAPTSASEDGADADAEAAVLDAYYAYWDATVAAQRGNPDPALFADNTRGSLVEEELATARQYAELGVSREGEPTFSDVVAEVDGDGADVWACVDNSRWVVPEAAGEPLGVLATGLHLERVDGAWYVTEYVSPPSDLAC